MRKYRKLENLPLTGRFGAMAAVSPQTILCEFLRYYPAGSSVEAATSPSRWDVTGKSADSASGHDTIRLKIIRNFGNLETNNSLQKQ